MPTVAELEQLSSEQLAVLLHQVDEQRQQLLVEAKAIKEVMARKLHQERLVQRLAGFTNLDVEAILKMAADNPDAFKSALAKTQQLRAETVVTPNSIAAAGLTIGVATANGHN